MNSIEHSDLENTPINVNPYSLASYYVEPFYNDMKLSSATCFFTRQNSKLYLVTNWHVVSGMDADTFKTLSQFGSVPNKLRVYLPIETEEGLVEVNDDAFFEVNLYNADDSIAWYEMRKNEKMVDVAIVPITDEIPNFYLPIEDAEEPFNESAEISIASDIFIIGFPFGRIGGAIPIWKRASVASEPGMDIDDMPYFFADTATREGMSGSPVVLYNERPITLISHERKLVSNHKTKFIGIYSGRIGANCNNENNAQLGRIWKASTIKDIISLYET